MLGAAAGLIAWSAVSDDWRGVPASWLLCWAVFCAVSNLLPASAGPHLSLSMSGPVNIGIAFLFPPTVSAAIVAIAAVSEWELKRDTTVMHASYNRAQLAISTALASAVFGIARHEVPNAAIAVGAVLTYTVANWALVAAAERSARGTAVGVIIRRLVPPGVVPAVSYLSLGILGIVLALASIRIGEWAVALLIIPLVSTRYAINASRDLERAERERRALSDRLVDEREREQARIASDIHDVVLQDLAALQIQTQNITFALGREQTEVAVATAATAHELAGQTITDLRQAISSLRRTTLGEAGLVATLDRAARSLHAESGIRATVHCDGGADPDSLSLPVSLLLYECCQEALANVVRHSSATAVEIHLVREGGAIELRVTDDGVGASGAPGLGLTLMKDKVALAGGGTWLTDEPPGNTALVVRIPATR